MLIYVVGGPGGSGLAVADDYLSAYDAKLTENMDIVFFDQRGIGPDHGLACPKAQAIFDTAETSIKQPEAAIAIAKAYATDCPAELKSRDLLPYVDTEQAIRDVELFRQAIGSPQIWIYGESYGTQFAQQYATAFPTSVKGVVVDGVVDLEPGFRRLLHFLCAGGRAHPGAGAGGLRGHPRLPRGYAGRRRIGL